MNAEKIRQKIYARTGNFVPEIVIRQKIYARTGNFVPEIVAEAVLELIKKERESCFFIKDEALDNAIAIGEAREREAIAQWYSDEGWILDKDDVPNAIRERSKE